MRGARLSWWRCARTTWAAPPFPDSFICVISRCELPVQVLVVGLLRSPVAECRVETLPIVTDLYVPRNILPSDFPRRVRGPVDALDLHRGVECFGQRVVVAYPGAPDCLADSQPFEPASALCREIVTRSVRMEY